MAQKEVFIGSVGPLLYDDTNFYALNTNGKARVGAAPTANDEVVRYQDSVLTSGDQTIAGKKTFSDEIELDSTLNHDGAAIGFFGAAPVAQATASAGLTDNSGGTADDTVQALTDPADGPVSADALRDDLVANLIPELRNNYADLAAKINKALTVLRDLGLIAT